MEKFMLRAKESFDELKDRQYPNKQLIEFFIDVMGIKQASNTVEVNNCDLIIAYYMALYPDSDFLKIKNEVTENKKYIFIYFKEFEKHINLDDYNFDLSYFDSTIFSDEKYKNVLNSCFKYIYYYTYNIDVLCSSLSSKHNIKKNTEEAFGIDSFASTINKRYNELVHESNKFHSQREVELRAIYDLMKHMDKVSEDNVFCIPDDIIKNISDIKLQFELYRLANCYNNNYFRKIITENKNLRMNNISYLKYIFSEFGFSLNNISSENMKLISDYGQVELIVDILGYLNELDYQLIDFNSTRSINAFLSTTPTILSYISELIKRHIITSDFVVKNPEILYKKSIIDNLIGKFDILSNNYEFLNKNSYNIDNSYLNEALLLNTSYFKDTMVLHSIYGLNKESLLPKSLFVDERFFEYIDSFIELNMFDFIKNNYSIITPDYYDVIKRIHVALKMRLPIFDYNGNLLPNIINKNEFYVSPSDLDNYLIIASNYMISPEIRDELSNNISYSFNNTDEINDFDKAFSINSQVYLIDNIPISRNKVLKNYSFLKKQYPGYDKQHLLESSIIHNSIMDVDDAFRINKIISSIMDFPKQKRI